jgi:Arc/MetJ-type ribon-helix-helix transcriptional regulator
MAAEVTTIRLASRDNELIDHFISQGEFTNKSELIRFAVKKFVYEMMLNELRRGQDKSEISSKDEILKVMRQLESIRKELWREYEKHIS